MSLSALLTDTCTIQTATFAKDATGLSRKTYATTTGVRCAIQAGGSSEAQNRSRITGRVTYTGFFEWGTGPQKTGDQVVWRSKTLNMVGLPQDRAGREHHEEVVLEEPADG